MATGEKIHDKILRDPIHGSIELDGALIKIIDTPQFQRLRRIKQCGATFVYPGAVHTRFEHSIGVCHIAGELMKGLMKLHGEQRITPDELLITPKDAFCVQIAALCHDLGHGPFSHLYDDCLDGKQNDMHHEHHEYRSAAILEKLMDDCNFWSSNENKRLKDENPFLEKAADLELIQTMITIAKDVETHRKKSELNETEKEQSCIKFMKEKLKEAGRDENKIYLLEIVANGLTGVDVDKMDYFARDSNGLGLPNRFDWRRFIQVARVIKVEPPVSAETCYRLCTNQKEIDNLYEMFHTRAILHKIAFHHKTTRIVQYLFKKAFKEAQKFVKVYCKNGESGQIKCKSILECWDDMEMFHLLDDSIVDIILKTVHPEGTPEAIAELPVPCIRVHNREGLSEVREILKRIVEKRKLPKFIGACACTKLNPVSEEDTISIQGRDIPCIWQTVKINYGMKEKNPLKQHYVYSKHDPDTAFPITDSEVSKLLVPEEFQEERFFLYYDTEHGDPAMCKVLRNWLKEKNKESTDSEEQQDEATGNDEEKTE